LAAVEITGEPALLHGLPVASPTTCPKRRCAPHATNRSTAFTGRTLLLNLWDLSSYKIDYSAILRARENARIPLIPLVGAGRFELPTPAPKAVFGILQQGLVFNCLGFRQMRTSG